MIVIHQRKILMIQLSKKEEKREERKEIADQFPQRYNGTRLVCYVEQPFTKAVAALQPGIERLIIPEKTRCSNSGRDS